MATKTLELPRQTRGSADDLGLEIRASTFDETSHSIEVVWSTGARVRRRCWVDGPYDEELVVAPESVRLDRLNAGAPLLNSHSAYDLRDVLGNVVRGSAKIVAGKGLARVALSKAQADADIVQKIRDGNITNISVGYRILKVEKTEGPQGEPALWRVIEWEPFEISAVAVPADPGSQFRAQDKEGQPEAYPFLMIEPDAPIRAACHARVRMALRARAAGL